MAGHALEKPPVVPLQPPAAIKRWCSQRDIYYARFVQEIQKKGTDRRALVVNPQLIYVCDANGSVRRIIPISRVKGIKWQNAEVSRNFGLSKDTEHQVLLEVPEEMDLVVSHHNDTKNGDLSAVAGLVDVVTTLAQRSGVTIPVEHLQCGRLSDRANFVPPEGYVDAIEQHLQARSKKPMSVDTSHRSHTRRRHVPPVVFTAGGSQYSISLSPETGLLECRSGEGVLLSPNITSLEYTRGSGVLEVAGAGVLGPLTGTSEREKILQLLGVLAAYARIPTKGLPKPSKKKRDNPEKHLVYSEGDTISIPANTISRVVSASFGTEDTTVDVTDVVVAAVSNGGLEFKVSAAALGEDPAPGRGGKVLHLVVAFDHLDTPSERDRAPAPSPSTSVPRSSAKPPSETDHEIQIIPPITPPSPHGSASTPTYRHDPYNPFRSCESDDGEVAAGSASSSFSSYCYPSPRSPASVCSGCSYGMVVQSASATGYTGYPQGVEGVPPPAPPDHDPSGMASPPLGSSFESSGLPALGAYDSDGSMSRRSSLSRSTSRAPYTHTAPQSPTLNRVASVGSSAQASDFPPTLLDSTGSTVEWGDKGSHQGSEHYPSPALTPSSTAFTGFDHAPPNMLPGAGYGQYSSSYEHTAEPPPVPIAPSPRNDLHYSPKPRSDPTPTVAQHAPRNRAFVDFTDTDGDVVRFEDAGGAIELKVNGKVLGMLRSFDYDPKSGRLTDGIGGCVLPPARQKGLEARLAALASKAGIPHNIKAEGPAGFDVVLTHTGENLGLSYEVLANGIVKITDVVPNGACGRAGVMCGVIHKLDGSPVRSGEDLRRVVKNIRESGRTSFHLEVRVNLTETAPVLQAPGKGGKGAKGARGRGGKAKDSDRSDALVRLFVLFKHGRRAEYASNQRVPLGAHVLVESREGVDLGLVAGARQGGRKDDRYRVQRIATPEEVETWKNYVTEEEQVLRYAREQARVLNAQHLELHRAEYQFDRQKLTLHYTGNPPQGIFNMLAQACSVFGCRVHLNNCLPGAGEPIDLSEPIIPTL